MNNAQIRRIFVFPKPSLVRDGGPRKRWMSSRYRFFIYLRLRGVEDVAPYKSNSLRTSLRKTQASPLLHRLPLPRELSRQATEGETFQKFPA